MPERFELTYTGRRQRRAPAGDDPPRAARLDGALRRDPDRALPAAASRSGSRRCRRACCRSPTATTSTPRAVRARLRGRGAARRGRRAHASRSAGRSATPSWRRSPYMLVVGDKEAEAGTVSVRARHEGDLGAMHARRAGRPAGRRGRRRVTMRINWVGVRNFAIIAAIAGLVFVSQEGFGGAAVSAEPDHPGALRRRPAVVRLQLLPPEPARLAGAEALAALPDHRLRDRHRLPAGGGLPAARATASRRSACSR